jgi:hypothetical protein
LALATIRAGKLLPHNGATRSVGDSVPGVGGVVAASTEIVIGDLKAQHVVIRPVRRSSPGLFDSWDGNWIVCEVEISAGGFRGRFSADMRSEEFHAFMEQVSELARTIEGAATFTTMEGQLAISLTTAADGRVKVAGEALDLAGSENRLEYSFHVDQASLPDLARSLEYVLAAFPVVGTQDE